MSYQLHPGENRGATELQLYDIAALQALYGRDDAAHTGDTPHNAFSETVGTVVRDRIFSIWDGVGNDTIDAISVSAAALIDLRPGYFSSIGPDSTVAVTAGQTPSVTNPGRLNISIAYGAYIENANGTAQGDLIIGNILSNRLDGGAGADVIYAEGRDSIYDVGDGTYTRVTTVGVSKTEAPPTAVQAFITDPSTQVDHLLGGAGDDYLHGGRGNDIIEGGADDDYIIGGGGDDEIWGGARDSIVQGIADGVDKVDYSASTSRITITFNGDSVAPFVMVDDGQGTDTLHSIERITGTARVDYLYYSGNIPEGYDLTIDFAGGNDDVLNGGHSTAGLRVVIGTDNNGTLSDYDGTPTGPGGHINLVDVHTQIIGSRHDDWISDESGGEKRIDGGDGADVITVGTGDALIYGGLNDLAADILTGGDGNDVIVGGGMASIFADGDEMYGGGGSDRIVLSGAYDRAEGGEGSDYIVFSVGEGKTIWDTVVTGGAGNDVIDFNTPGFGRGTIVFGEEDGHDMVITPAWAGYDMRAEFYVLDLSTLSKADVTFVWDPQVFISDQPPSEGPGTITMSGGLAIVVNATGASIFLGDFRGSSTYSPYFEAFEPPYSYPGSSMVLDFLPHIVFADGEIEPGDFNGASPAIASQIGSVAQYAVALDDYLDAVAAAPGANDGTSGDDDLRGGRGDDEIDGGDGDDDFHASGGQDVIDGGDGSDTLYMFGARLDFLISRDAGTGDVTLVDPTGLEGSVTVKSVEKIYFADDNEAFEPVELAGYYGTAGNDVIVGSARDSRIYGLAGEDDLSGGDGADLIDGGEDDDALYGEAGDDVLIGGAGDNILDGGDGADRADYSAAAGAVVVNLGIGTAADNGLGGTDSLAGIENLTGSAFADTLTGDAGANSLDGGGGTDALAGGDGDDTYFVDTGDVVTEDTDSGIDTIVTSLTSYALDANVENLVYVGLDGFTGTGNTLDNRIRGDQGDDDLSGGDGDDVFDATGGLDLIDGGNGIDTIRFTGSLYSLSYSRDGFGVATVVVPAGMEGTMQLTGVEYYYFESEDQSFTIDDLLLLSVTGTEGNDTLLEGNWLDNRIYGLGGDDVLWGKAGYDTLDGGDGDDVAHYAGSSDDFRIFRNETGDVGVGDLVGSDGWDTLIGVESLFFAGDNVNIDVIDLPMLGTSGNDSLDGSSRPDLLIGLDGDDSLDGLGGGDDLLGGLGNDLYLLGAGDDSASDDGGDDAYVYALGDGDDGIFDGAGIDYLAFGAGIAPEDVTVTVFEDESYVLSFAGASGSVTLWAAVWEDYAIEEVRFDDETVWTAQDLHDFAFGPPPMSAFRGDDDLSQGRAGGDLFALNGQIDYGMHCQIA